MRRLVFSPGSVPAAILTLALVAPSAVAPGGGPVPANPDVPEAPGNHGVRLADLWADLAVRDLDGRVWTAADFEGRVVLLEFWATWCAPCLADFPHLERARAGHDEQDLVILAISLDRSGRDDLRSFRRRQAMTWPVLFDGLGAAGAVARRFQVEYPPRSLLFDRRGRLVAVDGRGSTLDAALRVLFASE
ncbi:MAG: TlpA family protein disulfide reductase [Holophagales bacterium]|nr:TlpA family protein disulfide reductase [Holophagales bacterium]MYG31243.1 TlpA family protein disulfide reductase [Holophagales bacterium]MYI78837.1 TlpA family protein disulfide reductase [Holophagales bacterium]